MWTALHLALLAGAATPSGATESARTVIRRDVIDLRDLPARSRLSALTVDLHGRAGSGDRQPWVSMAVNGVVIARTWLGRQDSVTLRADVDERLLSMRSLVEVAAYVPQCETPYCRALAASVRVVGPVRQDYDAVRADATFAHLASRYRAGLTLLQGPDVDPAFGGLVRNALAPRARPLAEGGGLVYVSRQQPPDFIAPIRFDLGPVSLVRQDGVRVIPPDMLDRLTVAQVLRTGDHPVIWVRPGRDVPRKLDLDSGDIGIFGPSGRLMAFSYASDARTLHPAYGPGVDADGSQRTKRISRWLLLIGWAAASVGLGLVYRRLPRRVTATEAPEWAA